MSNTRQVFQLHAKGDSINGWRFNMKSKSVFLVYEDAEKFIPEFKELCCDQAQFECAEAEGLTVEIISLDLHV